MTNYQLDDAPGYIYEKMADHLAKRIASGDLAPGKPLPAERRLAEEYGVSLGTARHATHLLRKRGLVVTIRSLGTFVAEPATSGRTPAHRDHARDDRTRSNTAR
ncbi:winged helix-turn-helix domain-containing protein [Amycolatopsis thermoflava]|uniref:winged helix-turn-helix domain-containing protein n=1 Tax=Amycolatopsis thermoflava TaxID=84480 RepID=UPI00040BDF74|nr:winged helix-turn-helix domain-containing protein [Amycolatopsis thermoflava]